MRKPYSNILVALLKGVVYSHNERLWDELLKPENEADIKKYFADIYLEVVIDKSEGFAYLKQRMSDDEEEEYPRLIEKRKLNFHISLLCLMLRKQLIEKDSEGEKAVLTKEEILNMVKPFYRQSSNEAGQDKQVEAAINKVIEKGFLRKMKTEDKQYEINRIIKAFVNAEAVKDSLEKLRLYTGETAE